MSRKVEGGPALLPLTYIAALVQLVEHLVAHLLEAATIPEGRLQPGTQPIHRHLAVALAARPARASESSVKVRHHATVYVLDHDVSVKHVMSGTRLECLL